MKFNLSVTCDNAAFADNGPHLEMSQILERLVLRLNMDRDQNPLFCGEYVLRDSNGNKVGTAVFTEDAP
jgi:hypothetical protein